MTSVGDRRLALGTCSLNNESGGVIRWLLFLLLLCCALGCYFFPKYTLAPLGGVLVSDHKPVDANAIVVLLGDDTPNRAVKAFELFGEKHADKIVYAAGYDGKRDVSGDYPGLTWPLQYIRYHVALRSLGVPQEALTIVESPSAYDTANELRAIAAYGRDKGWTNVLLVTSATHTLRSGMIWKRVAPDINGVTVAAHESGLDEWWGHGRTRRSVSYEYLALIKEGWHQILDIAGFEPEEGFEP